MRTSFNRGMLVLAIGVIKAPVSGALRAPLAPERASAQVLVGKQAPDFVVLGLDGRRITLADFKEKALLINFWATWCPACRQEMPWLAQLRETYAAQGFEVLGIVTDNAPPEKLAAIRERYKVRYPFLSCNHAAAQAYGGVPELPESFLVDRHGKVVAVMNAAESKEEIEAKIQLALRSR